MQAAQSRRSSFLVAISAILATYITFSSAPANAASISLEPYGKLPALEVAALSTDGGHVAIVVTPAEKRLLLIMAGTKIQKAYRLDDLKIRSMMWASEDILLLEYSNTAALGIGWTAAKAELHSYLVLSIRNEQLRDVFAKSRLITGSVNRFFGFVRKDDTVYGYFSGITMDRTGGGELDITNSNPDLYEVDLVSGEAHRLARRAEDNVWRDWAVDAAGQVAATLDFSTSGGNWKIINAHREKIQTGNNPNGNISLLGLGRTPDTIVYSVGDPATGTLHYYEIKNDGSAQQEVLTEPDADTPTRRFSIPQPNS